MCGAILRSLSISLRFSFGRLPLFSLLVVVSLRLSSTIMRFRCPCWTAKHSSLYPQKAMYPTVIRCNLESFAVAACCTSGKYDFKFAISVVCRVESGNDRAVGLHSARECVMFALDKLHRGSKFASLSFEKGRSAGSRF